MRLLLDKMISATVAEQLRARGHDVVAVQDVDLEHVRGIDDCVLLDHAAQQHRAVVTDNIPDFVRCHHRRIDREQPHYGLLLFTNDTFPRHRHDAFISPRSHGPRTATPVSPRRQRLQLDPLAPEQLTGAAALAGCRQHG